MTWKGYVAHHVMKQNRLLALEQADYRCLICGAEAVHVHHKDGSITNHDPDNLMPVCARCHARLHGANRPPKWSRVMLRFAMMHRGLDPKDIADKTGMTYQNILHILKTGKTKNSTMKRIAGALEYPIEFFIIPGDTDDTPPANIDDEKAADPHLDAYSKLNQAIKDRLATLGSTGSSYWRYLLTKELREHFKVRSYTLVAGTHLDEAIALIKTWEPVKGFDLAAVQEAKHGSAGSTA